MQSASLQVPTRRALVLLGIHQRVEHVSCRFHPLPLSLIRLSRPSRFREVSANMLLHVVAVKVFAVGMVEWNIGSAGKCAGILL